MSQIRNRFDIKQSILEEEKIGRKMPNFFNDNDEIKPLKGLALSVVFHIVFIILFASFSALYSMLFPHLPKPKMQVKDVEFKLVQGEAKKPINPNTKIRSDRDSRAGGKHDPKRAVSQPSPTPSIRKPASAPLKKQTKTAQKPKTKPVSKPLQKVSPKTVVKKQPQTQKKTVKTVAKKPSPIKAPIATKPIKAPSYKPSVKPSAPKIATAPKSPFKIATPPSKAPVGSTYRPSVSGSSKGGSSKGTSSGNITPKFSASKSGSASGSGSSRPSSGSYAYRGSSGSNGYSSRGNPSPGNPNGAPGIDAIRQPNWGPYMRDLEQKIKRNWSPPKGDTSKRIVITFTIGRDGRLLSHRITKSSGIPLADRAAMSAIELTAPFRPLPPEFRGQSVPIEFTFDYNVLNSVLK